MLLVGSLMAAIMSIPPALVGSALGSAVFTRLSPRGAEGTLSVRARWCAAVVAGFAIAVPGAFHILFVAVYVRTAYDGSGRVTFAHTIPLAIAVAGLAAASRDSDENAQQIGRHTVRHHAWIICACLLAALALALLSSASTYEAATAAGRWLLDGLDEFGTQLIVGGIALGAFVSYRYRRRTRLRFPPDPRQLDDPDARDRALRLTTEYGEILERDGVNFSSALPAAFEEMKTAILLGAQVRLRADELPEQTRSHFRRAYGLLAAYEARRRGSQMPIRDASIHGGLLETEVDTWFQTICKAEPEREVGAAAEAGSFTRALLERAREMASQAAAPQIEEPFAAAVGILARIGASASVKVGHYFGPDEMTDEECAWIVLFLYHAAASISSHLEVEGCTVSVDEAVVAAVSPLLSRRTTTSRREIVSKGRRLAGMMSRQMDRHAAADEWARAVHLGVTALVVSHRSDEAIPSLTTLYDVLFHKIRRDPARHWLN